MRSGERWLARTLAGMSDAERTVSTRNLAAPVVLRFDDLDRPWDIAPRSNQPGHLRWLMTYVGGPPGHLHEHPETGLVAERAIMGMMGLPVGQRQYGLHRHTTTEIYLVLRGRVESIESQGHRQIAGPLDLLYIPAEAAHAVRTVGDEDALVLFLHDEHERLGESRYVTDDDASLVDDPLRPQLVRWDDLEPWWDAADARTAGRLRWSVAWIAPENGAVAINPGGSAVSPTVAMGATTILASQVAPPASWPLFRYLRVIEGRARIVEHPALGTLEPYDAVIVPPDHVHSLRPVGLDPLRVVWFHEHPTGSPSAL